MYSCNDLQSWYVCFKDRIIFFYIIFQKVTKICIWNTYVLHSVPWYFLKQPSYYFIENVLAIWWSLLLIVYLWLHSCRRYHLVSVCCLPFSFVAIKFSSVRPALCFIGNVCKQWFWWLLPLMSDYRFKLWKNEIFRKIIKVLNKKKTQKN